MKMDSKKILTIGAGAVVGYLLFCKFIKSGAEKSLEGGAGASTDEGGFGGGGGGIFGGGAIVPPPAITPIVPQGYIPIAIPREQLLISNIQSGNSPIASGDTSANIGRATPPPPPSTSTPIVVPSSVDISNVSDASANIGRDTSTSSTRTTPIVDFKPNPSTSAKFIDFDGNENFQDLLL
jgi:hypothetical protein